MSVRTALVPGTVSPVLDVPKNIERLVMKLLEKDPQNRYASARKVRNELLTLEAQLDPAMSRLKRGTNGG